MSPDPDEQPGAGEKDAAVSVAQQQIARHTEVIDAIRKRSDLTAKGLGALGTAALGGIALSKVGDVFPLKLQWASAIWTFLMVVGFVLMAAVVIVFVVRLAKVNEVVRLTSRGLDHEPPGPAAGAGWFARALAWLTKRLDPLLLNDPGTEARLIEQVFENEDDLNGAPSLRAYEARAFRLRRIAERERQTAAGTSETDPDVARADALEKRADAIQVDVLATLLRAVADVVRHRSAAAFTGISTLALYLTAVLGFLLFAMGTDYLDSDREHHDATKQLAIASDCAKAMKAFQDAKASDAVRDKGQDQRLKAAQCPALPTPKTPQKAAASKTPPSAISAAETGVVEDLTARWKACLASIPKEEPPKSVARCVRIAALTAEAARRLAEPSAPASG